MVSPIQFAIVPNLLRRLMRRFRGLLLMFIIFLSYYFISGCNLNINLSPKERFVNGKRGKMCPAFVPICVCGNSTLALHGKFCPECVPPGCAKIYKKCKKVRAIYFQFMRRVI